MEHTNKIRGGMGTKGNPAEIQRVLDNVRKDEIRTNNDLDRLKKDKDELLIDLADLRVKEKHVQDENFSAATKKHIADAITHIQKKIKELNGLLPKVNLSDDHAKIQDILKKYTRASKRE